MREGKGFGCWCRNGSQERSLLSEFLPPPVLNTGERHPAVVPEEKKGQDKLQGLPAAPQVCASHPLPAELSCPQVPACKVTPGRATFLLMHCNLQPKR